MIETSRDEALPAFGTILRRLRLAAQLSQEMLAERARISVEAVSTLERGARRAPQRETLNRLADALELTAAQRTTFERAAARFVRDPKGAADPAPPAPPAGVPVPLTSFIGREAEAADVAALLHTRRLVTLCGAGGIGKTRTALHVGNALRDRWADGAWLVELAPISDGARVPATIAAALGIASPTTADELPALVAALARRCALLILDNCEHLIDACAGAADAILRACPSVVVLATSRQSLGISGEATYRLPSLGIPSMTTIDGLTADEALRHGAVALFVERGVCVDRRFALSDANAPIVARIAARLDGIPLALELAAARLNVLSVRDLDEKLDERFRILTAGDRTALPRQRTMRALIDWSYDLLDREERAVFRRLSVFAGGFTLELATAVVASDDVRAAEVFEFVASLVDKCLVETDFSADETRYRLLESMREYGRAKLAEHGEDAAVASAHAHACLAFAQQLDRAWVDTPDRKWVPLAEAELENWRAALDWTLVANTDPRLGAHLVAALRWVWYHLALPEGRRWAARALEGLDVQQYPELAARLELTEAQLAIGLMQRKAALAALERATSLHARLDGPDQRLALAEIQRLTGRAYTFLGRFSEADTLLNAALTTFRERDDRKLIGISLEALAGLRFAAGNVAAARPLYAEALAIFRAIGADRSASVVATNLAEAEFRGGDTAAALANACEALKATRARNDTRSTALNLANSAAYLVALERWDEAAEHAREALDKARRVNDEINAMVAIQHVAAASALRTDRAPGAERVLRASAALLLGYVDARFAALEAAREYTEQHEYDAAIESLRKTFAASELENHWRAGARCSDDEAFAQAMDLR